MCPHCGLLGACPPGTCLVRDSYDLSGLPWATKPKAARKMPDAAAKAPKAKATNRAAKSFAKKEILALWDEAAKRDATLAPKPIPYGHRGSKASFYQVRIYGTLADIKNTLADLKTLRRFESGTTRLGLSLKEMTEKSSRKVIADRWECYIQIFQRG